MANGYDGPERRSKVKQLGEIVKVLDRVGAVAIALVVFYGLYDLALHFGSDHLDSLSQLITLIERQTVILEQLLDKL